MKFTFFILLSMFCIIVFCQDESSDAPSNDGKISVVLAKSKQKYDTRTISGRAQSKIAEIVDAYLTEHPETESADDSIIADLQKKAIEELQIDTHAEPDLMSLKTLKSQCEEKNKDMHRKNIALLQEKAEKKYKTPQIGKRISLRYYANLDAQTGKLVVASGTLVEIKQNEYVRINEFQIPWKRICLDDIWMFEKSVREKNISQFMHDDLEKIAATEKEFYNQAKKILAEKNARCGYFYFDSQWNSVTNMVRNEYLFQLNEMKNLILATNWFYFSAQTKVSICKFIVEALEEEIITENEILDENRKLLNKSKIIKIAGYVLGVTRDNWFIFGKYNIQERFCLRRCNGRYFRTGERFCIQCVRDGVQEFIFCDDDGNIRAFQGQRNFKAYREASNEDIKNMESLSKEVSTGMSKLTLLKKRLKRQKDLLMLTEKDFSELREIQLKKEILIREGNIDFSCLKKIVLQDDLEAFKKILDSGVDLNSCYKDDLPFAGIIQFAEKNKSKKILDFLEPYKQYLIDAEMANLMEEFDSNQYHNTLEEK